MRVPIPQTTEPDTAGMAENPTLDIRPDDVVVTAGDIEIGRYVFAPDAPAVESPKPYWHPLRALDGGLVTGYRPWDHRWHKGLQMTWTHVSGTTSGVARPSSRARGTSGWTTSGASATTDSRRSWHPARMWG